MSIAVSSLEMEATLSKDTSKRCKWLDDTEATELDWIKRVKLIKDTTFALSYLHHACHSPIFHRDISSNNILLNLDFEVRVSDFGTGRLLDPYSSNQTTLVGTHKYIAHDPCLSLPSNRRAKKDIVFAATIAFVCLRSNVKFRQTMKRVSQEFLCQKRVIANRLQIISVVQLKNHDLYIEGEPSKIQLENALQHQDGEIRGKRNSCVPKFHHLGLGLHSQTEFHLRHPSYTDQAETIFFAMLQLQGSDTSLNIMLLEDNNESDTNSSPDCFPINISSANTS
ncbi:hypothetical protein V6N12_073947 [Hibiscus sabdariffa]|uniref:non-specific serine/threonine protein kinase n=1 Tax=Hibiscus sabdariffa TaxID=183260 RepID=A0ABR2ANP3_9ROSI